MYGYAFRCALRYRTESWHGGRTEADLRIRALSAADGGALQWQKISNLVDPKQISLVSKSEKKKSSPPRRLLACYATGALQQTCSHNSF